MKRLYFFIAVSCLTLPGFSQDITGLWKGTMFNDSTKQSLPYEVFISKENGKYTGYSHSWFLVNDKKYYGIKKIKIRVAKDGKIVIQDAELLENDYPVLDNVHQLNVLDLVNSNTEATMDGPFATNRTKQYSELTGHINIKRVSPSTESSLMQYLQRSGADNGIAAVK